MESALWYGPPHLISLVRAMPLSVLAAEFRASSRPSTLQAKLLLFGKAQPSLEYNTVRPFLFPPATTKPTDKRKILCRAEPTALSFFVMRRLLAVFILRRLGSWTVGGPDDRPTMQFCRKKNSRCFPHFRLRLLGGSSS